MAGHAPPPAPVDATLADRHARQVSEGEAFDAALQRSAGATAAPERRWLALTMAGCVGLLVLGFAKALKGGKDAH
ncbi:MAG: hypothetical protein EAZ99_05695 [Alphaproteobacteria bacterium]|nr:hypothetical protein [Alphaproteobacteria bacterium]TAD90543.1 MAG: hypothetical protein EAZ99_05695 [Alphaproteobacteria bacterium]